MLPAFVRSRRTARVQPIRLTAPVSVSQFSTPGIFAAHNGFKTNGVSRIVANVNFTNSATTNDLYGHGTHVAGTCGRQ